MLFKIVRRFRSDFHVRQIFDVKIGSKYIRHFADGNIGAGIDLVDQILHLSDLESIDDKINHGARDAGVTAASFDPGHATLKRTGQSIANLIWSNSDDDRRLGTIKTFYNIVYGLGSGHICNNGIQRQDPAMHDQAQMI